MHINYKAPTIELTDEVYAYVEEKLAGIEKHLGNIDLENVQVDVELARNENQQSGQIFRVDVTVHAGGDRTHAVGHGETLHAAVDEMKDELSRRLKRVKGRRLDALRRGGAKIKNMLRFWK